jgi:hypothetical protein
MIWFILLIVMLSLQDGELTMITNLQVNYIFQKVNHLCSHFEAYRDIPKIS